MEFINLLKIGVKFPKKEVRLPKGWPDITKSQYNNEVNFFVLTGQKNNVVVIDLDKKDEEIIGLKWFINNFGELEDLNTLVTTSVNGG